MPQNWKQKLSEGIKFLNNEKLSFYQGLNSLKKI